MARPAMLKVDIVADAKGVKDGVSEAEGRFNRLGNAAKKAGKIAAVGLGAGLAVVAKVGYDAAKAAAEDAEAAAKLATVLRNAAGATDAQVAATERWITKQGKALGIADDELRPAISKLAAATGDLGKAQDLAALAMDVSAGTGKNLQAVTEALVRAQNGSVGGLSRLGVATKNAAGETLTLDQITGKLAETYKGSATTAANSAAGQQRRLMLRFSELREEIGAKLLPIINKLVGWLINRFLPGAEKLAGNLSKTLGPAFRRVGEFITTKVVPAARMIFGWFMEKIAPGLQRTLSPILDGVRRYFAKMQEAVDRNRPALEKLFAAVKKVAEFLASKVLPVIGKVVGKGFDVLAGAVGGVVDVVARLVGWIDTAIDKMGDLIAWVGKIKMPNLDLNPFGKGASGYRLEVTGPTGGHGTGALAGWQSVVSRGPELARQTVIVDNRSFPTNVTVEGLVVDRAGTAREIERLLQENAQRLGRTTALVLP